MMDLNSESEKVSLAAVDREFQREMEGKIIIIREG